MVRRYKDSQELSPLFCVETSCYLVEVAWQAYYDPYRVALDDSFAPGRQDLSYLGLELVVRAVLRSFVRSFDRFVRLQRFFSMEHAQNR